MPLVSLIGSGRPGGVHRDQPAAGRAGRGVGVIRLTPTPASSHIEKIIFVALAFGVPTVDVRVLGDSIAYRRAHNAWLDERARRAEAERDAKAQLAAAAERSRIAREMHDIIAHNLSVIVGLADGGRYAAVRSPERSAQALGAIAGAGREALSELRQLLGVLTENDHPAAELAPQPGLTDLEALLDRVRAALGMAHPPQAPQLRTAADRALAAAEPTILQHAPPARVTPR
jgi:signal transduction histidine kinase